LLANLAFVALAFAQGVLSRRDAASPALPLARRSSAATASDEVLQLLALAERTEAEAKRLLILVQELATRPHRRAVALVPGGEWKVAWTERPLHYKWLPFSSSEAQSFSTTSGEVSSQLSYGPVKITAGGNLSPEGHTDSPTYAAKMTRGELTIGPLKVPLLVFGQNKLELRYSDARLRVFQGESGLAVQTQA